MKYKANITVDAIQFNENNRSEVRDFAKTNHCRIRVKPTDKKCWVSGKQYFEIIVASSNKSINKYQARHGDYLVVEYDSDALNDLTINIKPMERSEFEIKYSPVCVCGCHE